MVTLLVDVNLDGHARILARRLNTDDWREFRDQLNLRILFFEEIGQDRTTKDNVVWRLCQEQGFYLLTANRTAKGQDSLETTIRREGTATSIPGLTIADAERIYHSVEYLDKVIEKLLDCLLFPNNYAGSGRLFLP